MLKVVPIPASAINELIVNSFPSEFVLIVPASANTYGLNLILFFKNLGLIFLKNFPNSISVFIDNHVIPL